MVAASADPDVTVLVGGRVKHMTHAMNDVLRDSFADVSASLARQKSRVLVARGPKPGAVVLPAQPGPSRPRADRVRARRGVRRHEDRHRHPGAARLPRPHGAGDARRWTSGAGSGVLAAALARSRPELTVLAVDQSAAAVASTRATAAANGLADRIRVVRDDAAASVPDGSVDLVVCNPPFHVGAAVVTTAADRLFAAAGPRPAPRRRAVDGLQQRAALQAHARPAGRADHRRRPDAEVHRDGLPRR